MSNKKHTGFGYRADIDGLRAFAIIPVVLFHAGVFGFSGGYVGVDIFFVISGFLITSILYNQLRKGTFSLLKFWEKRIKRIFPALIFMMVTTMIVGYFILLLPSELVDLGKSVFAQSFFLSNIFFMRKSDYFTDVSETSPLLHTWTLSVEEQFYILMPTVLLFLYKFMKKRLFLIFTSLFVMSLFYNIYLVHVVPGDSFTLPFTDSIWGSAQNLTAAFFMLFTRAWELLLGALLALSAFTIRSKRCSEILSAAGLLAILISVVLFNPETYFPGIAALLPTIGCAGIILANSNHKTHVSRLLSLKPFVWIGLISYSLYLWHWPVFVFAKIFSPVPSFLLTLGLILLALLLAIVSYRFVEMPLRKSKVSTKKTLVIGILTMVVIASLGLILSNSDPTRRTPEHARAVVYAFEDVGARMQECHTNKAILDTQDDGPCFIGIKNPETPIEFILWGDSHAAVVLDVLDEMAEEHDTRGVVFSHDACLPILNVYRTPAEEVCQAKKKRAIEFIEQHNIPYILLVAKWNAYVHSDKTDTNRYLIGDTSNGNSSDSGAKRVFRMKLEEMLNTFNSEDRQTYIMKQVPLHEEYDMREAFYTAFRTGVAADTTSSTLSLHNKNNEFVNSVFETVSKNAQVKIITPEEVLCTSLSGCLLQKEGVTIYRDESHLNATGAQLLRPVFQEMFNDIIDSRQN